MDNNKYEISMEILFEDNHLMVVNKAVGEIVQGDKTGDEPLVETIKKFLKVRDAKPGNVFCGVVHRLDRPVSGVVVFAKTSKALERMNKMFAEHKVEKTYWAFVTKGERALVEGDGERLTHWVYRNEKQNKSYAYDKEKPKTKWAALSYKVLKCGVNYNLVEVNLETGRHHQIRCQLSTVGMPIKGDLKYGSKRSNRDGGICLHARSVRFVHPVSKEMVEVMADVPGEWNIL